MVCAFDISPGVQAVLPSTLSPASAAQAATARRVAVGHLRIRLSPRNPRSSAALLQDALLTSNMGDTESEVALANGHSTRGAVLESSIGHDFLDEVCAPDRADCDAGYLPRSLPEGLLALAAASRGGCVLIGGRCSMRLSALSER